MSKNIQNYPRGFRPMKGVAITDEHIAAISTPHYASIKLDGIRAVVWHGVVYSNSLTVIPSAQVQRMFGRPELHGLEGELIAGTADPLRERTNFQRTVSAVQSRNKEDDLRFFVFDAPLLPDRYAVERNAWLKKLDVWNDSVVLLPQHLCGCGDSIMAMVREAKELKLEGIMLKPLNGRYKYGRATLNSGELLKVKFLKDSEAEIIGWKELERNENAAELDSFGLMQRSSHADGKVPAGILGAFLVRDIYSSETFWLGGGYTAAQRLAFWETRERMRGAILRYSYQECGSKDAPRQAVFDGVRAAFDLGK